MTDADVPTPRVATAALLIVAALALLVAFLVEFGAPAERGDPDNPSDSVAFLRAAYPFFAYSGAALMVGGATLIAGVLGVARIVRPGGLSLAYTSATVFGLLAGGFFAVGGMLRLSATGTGLYIADLDPRWGESAYIVVQMAGTQGLIATGLLGLAGWLLATAILGARRRLPGLLAIGLPAAVIVGLLAFDVVVPTADLADFVFPIYVFSLTIGLPLGIVAVAATILVPAGARRFASGGQIALS
jgi:hypothetical protein